MDFASHDISLAGEQLIADLKAIGKVLKRLEKVGFNYLSHQVNRRYFRIIRNSSSEEETDDIGIEEVPSSTPSNIESETWPL